MLTCKRVLLQSTDMWTLQPRTSFKTVCIAAYFGTQLAKTGQRALIALLSGSVRSSYHADHHACSGAAVRACRYMPLAVTHFVGSGLFNRALRYWARTATQAAKTYNSNADGFQLSDLILTPIRKGKPEVTGDRQYKNTEVRSQVQRSDGLQLPIPCQTPVCMEASAEGKAAIPRH